MLCRNRTGVDTRAGESARRHNQVQRKINDGDRATSRVGEGTTFVVEIPMGQEKMQVENNNDDRPSEQ